MVKFSLQIKLIGGPGVGHVPVGLNMIRQQTFLYLEAIREVCHGGKEISNGFSDKGRGAGLIFSDSLHMDICMQDQRNTFTLDSFYFAKK